MKGTGESSPRASAENACEGTASLLRLFVDVLLLDRVCVLRCGLAVSVEDGDGDDVAAAAAAITAAIVVCIGVIAAAASAAVVMVALLLLLWLCTRAGGEGWPVFSFVVVGDDCCIVRSGVRSV